MVWTRCCLESAGWIELLRRLCRDGLGKDDALDDDAFGFEVGDAVVGAVSHEDGFGEEGDEGAGFFGEPAVD